MENLNERLCWMLENNRESFLTHDHKTKEFIIHLVGAFKQYQFKGRVPEGCTIGYNSNSYSIHDMETKEVLCKVSRTHISSFTKSYVTEGMKVVDTVEELPKKLCCILQHNRYSLLRYDHVFKRYIVFFRADQKHFIPKGYAIDFANKCIIHAKTGKLLCGYQRR